MIISSLAAATSSWTAQASRHRRRAAPSRGRPLRRRLPCARHQLSSERKRALPEGWAKTREESTASRRSAMASLSSGRSTSSRKAAVASAAVWPAVRAGGLATAAPGSAAPAAAATAAAAWPWSRGPSYDPWEACSKSEATQARATGASSASARIESLANVSARSRDTDTGTTARPSSSSSRSPSSPSPESSASVLACFELRADATVRPPVSADVPRLRRPGPPRRPESQPERAPALDPAPSAAAPSAPARTAAAATATAVASSALPAPAPDEAGEGPPPPAAPPSAEPSLLAPSSGSVASSAASAPSAAAPSAACACAASAVAWIRRVRRLSASSLLPSQRCNSAFCSRTRRTTRRWCTNMRRSLLGSTRSTARARRSPASALAVCTSCQRSPASRSAPAMPSSLASSAAWKRRAIWASWLSRVRLAVRCSTTAACMAASAEPASVVARSTCLDRRPASACTSRMALPPSSLAAASTSPPALSTMAESASWARRSPALASASARCALRRRTWALESLRRAADTLRTSVSAAAAPSLCTRSWCALRAESWATPWFQAAARRRRRPASELAWRSMAATAAAMLPLSHLPAAAEGSPGRPSLVSSSAPGGDSASAASADTAPETPSGSSMPRATVPAPTTEPRADQIPAVTSPTTPAAASSALEAARASAKRSSAAARARSMLDTAESMRSERCDRASTSEKARFSKPNSSMGVTMLADAGLTRSESGVSAASAAASSACMGVSRTDGGGLAVGEGASALECEVPMAALSLAVPVRRAIHTSANSRRLAGAPYCSASRRKSLIMATASTCMPRRSSALAVEMQMLPSLTPSPSS
mmetsp:Transcript_9431/g.36816  ORF Transcript_9431/g.36816 Transcript_9431/m.36816 type:complete len:832 (+) Transcript_9431:1171-3666(+)